MELWAWGGGVILVGLLAHLARLRRHVARFDPVRSRGYGPLRQELRRRTFTLGHADGRGRLALAQVFEQRLKLLRLLGAPVWCRSHQVELPATTAGMLASLTAHDFDADFPPSLQQASFVDADDRLSAVWRMSPSRH